MEATPNAFDQMVDPKHLLSYAYSFINILVHGDVSHLSTGGTVELSQPVGGHVEHITHLGDDPVKAGGPETEAKAVTAVEEADHMSQGERDSYEEAMKHPEKMTETTVKDLKMNGTHIIMADGEKGGVHAKEYITDLPDDTKVKVFTYTYTGDDGLKHQETGYVFDECGNPAVDAAPDAVVTPEPVAPAPEKACEILPPRADIKLIEGPDGKPMAVAVVTRHGEPGDLWVDDGDGKIWEYDGDKAEAKVDRHDLSLDSGDKIAPGIPKEVVEQDVELLKQNGFKGNFVIYDLIDCNGRSVVMCWNIEKHCWGVFYDNTWHPIDQTGVDAPIIDTDKELQEYLAANAPKKH